MPLCMLTGIEVTSMVEQRRSVKPLYLAAHKVQFSHFFINRKVPLRDAYVKASQTSSETMCDGWVSANWCEPTLLRE